ncbi:hypothetical protein [Streptomyces cinereoruber]|uniref:hypothetical protein n=1 Tax=Streptomyces cinereoruber TaxID=67260 RepID=UPI00366886B1
MNSPLDPLPASRRSGDEPIRADGERVATLGDFWSWACSDLAGNTMRGALAEYLVAMALGAADGVRTEWDAVDVRTPEEWRVEVKSTAYLQSWAQSRPSVPTFGIAPTVSWDARTGASAPEALRSSDVYVFCLLHHEDKRTLDPLDLDQWTFYVLPTKVLNTRCPDQKTIGLSSLLRLAPVRTDFAGLRAAVGSCAGAPRDPAPGTPAPTASSRPQEPPPAPALGLR